MHLYVSGRGVRSNTADKPIHMLHCLCLGLRNDKTSVPCTT